MEFATFDGYEIKVRSITETGEDIADMGRTAGGKERRDTVVVKRAWEVETPPMPLSELAPLESHLWAIQWGYGDWWYQYLPAPVRARIDFASWSKAFVLGVSDYVQVSFRVIEQ